MTGEASAALAREISDAGRGVSRLVRYDPRWPDGFDFSTVGFLRSFFGPLLALPFLLVFVAMLTSHGGTEPLRAPDLWAAGLAHLLQVAIYTVVVAALARPFGFVSGFGAFIVIVNWSDLFVTLAMSAMSVLTLLGETGDGLLRFLWLVVFALSIFIIWRAARETLATEIAPALLMVVLSVAASIAADQLAAVLVNLVA